VSISRCFTWSGKRFGEAAHASAAAPDTCGVAIEVPLSLSNAFPGNVLRMSTPGAARSTVVWPEFEKVASASS
jgi:hypothetical protein